MATTDENRNSVIIRRKSTLKHNHKSIKRTTADDPEEWPVDAIIDIRMINNIVYYKVSWSDKKYQPTWQEISDLENCKRLVNNFMKKWGDKEIPSMYGNANLDKIPDKLVYSNWVELKQVVDKAYSYRTMYNCKIAKIEYQEYKDLMQEGIVYFLCYSCHIFVFIKSKEQIVYVSDGGNTLVNDEEAKKDIQSLLKGDFNYLLNDAQIAYNQCGSSAVTLASLRAN